MSTSRLVQDLSHVINTALELEVRKKFDAKKAEMVEQFRQELDVETDKEIAGIMLHIQRAIDIQQAGERIIITVVKQNASR